MSTPSTFSRYGDAKFRQEAKDNFSDDEVTQASSDADKLELLVSIRSFSSLFMKAASRQLPPTEADDVQQGLHVLWYMFTQIAKGIDKDSAFHDKLILLLLATKELDSIHRSIQPSTDVMPTNWECYGFFDSLQASWQQTLDTGTMSQQCNLAAFSSMALAIGVWSDALSPVALWYLREALETDDEAKCITLLPASVIWFKHANLSLLHFSATNKSSSSSGLLLAPGAQATKAGVNSPGFSLDRWLFWRKRFQQLSYHVDAAVAKEAKEGFMAMIVSGRELEYDVPGEGRFHEKLQKTMWEALQKSGKESLGVDEIEVDVDWVD